jgi:hypothetical protein
VNQSPENVPPSQLPGLGTTRGAVSPRGGSGGQGNLNSYFPSSDLELLRIRWSSTLSKMGNAILAQQSVTPGFRRLARSTGLKREGAERSADGSVLLRFTWAVNSGAARPGCSQ